MIILNQINKLITEITTHQIKDISLGLIHGIASPLKPSFMIPMMKAAGNKQHIENVKNLMMKKDVLGAFKETFRPGYKGLTGVDNPSDRRLIAGITGQYVTTKSVPLVTAGYIYKKIKNHGNITKN